MSQIRGELQVATRDCVATAKEKLAGFGCVLRIEEERERSAAYGQVTDDTHAA